MEDHSEEVKIARFGKDMDIIAKLDDEPNDVGGLTAAELKAKFDEGGVAVKAYLNELLVPLLEGLKGASVIGAMPFGFVTGENVQSQIEQIFQSVRQMVQGEIPDGSIGPDKLCGILRSYYIRFEPEDWNTEEEGRAVLTIPQSVHGLPVVYRICSYTLHMLIARSAMEYDEASAAAAKSRFIAMQAAALAANRTVPETYPTAMDGHVVLSWEQVQYYLLEQKLVGAAEARAKAEELGFDWSCRIAAETEETVSLEELLAAGYMPALGGSSAGLDAVWSAEALRGLRFRRAVEGVTGVSKKYDLDGRMSALTWGVRESLVRLDTETGNLCLSCEEPYAGELLVIGAPGEYTPAEAIQILLNTGPNNGYTEAVAVVNGEEYDAYNLSTNGEEAPNGTFLVRPDSEQ